MLIVLNDSLIKKVNEVDDKVVELIENLRGCMREGTHYILASRKLCNTIASGSQFTNSTRMCFNYLSENMATIAYIRDIVTVYVEVSQEVKKMTLQKVEEKLVIKTPVEYFVSVTTLGKTSLICENISDAEFYCKICKNYLKYKELPLDIAINFDFIGGGGITIVDSYQQIALKDTKLSLVIVDSDKESEKSEIGLTAKKVRNKYKDEYPNCHLFILREREKENLIPITVYNVFLEERDKESFRRLKFLSDSQGELINDLNNYGDIKGGIKISYIINTLGYETEIYNLLCDEFRKYKDYLEQISYPQMDIDKLISYWGNAGFDQPLLRIIGQSDIDVEYEIKSYIDRCKEREKKNKAYIIGLSPVFKEICKNLDLSFYENRMNNNKIDLEIRKRYKNKHDVLQDFYTKLEKTSTSWQSLIPLLISWGCGYKIEGRS